MIEPIAYAVETYFTERRGEFERYGTVVYHAPMGMATMPLYSAAAISRRSPSPAGVTEAAVEAPAHKLAGEALAALDRGFIGIAHDKMALLAAQPLLSPSMGWGIKSLVWGTLRATDDDLEAQDAHSPIGHYIAVENGWFLVGQSGYNPATSLVGAKIAAQADYEARIRSALSAPPPQPGVAGLVEALAALAKCEDAFERIRNILINRLVEPDRSAFWEAVRGRDLVAGVRAALASMDGRK